MPFAPAGGGQHEIIEDQRLLYSSESDAVAKISGLFADPEQQLELHRRGIEAGRQLSSDCFVNNVREIVEEFLERQK